MSRLKTALSQLKIEKGASKVRRAPLKVTIDGTVSDDLEAMCQWSENDPSYLVNLLLGFAIAQSEDFQKYKAGQALSLPTARVDERTASSPTRLVTSSASGAAPHLGKGVSA